MKPRISKVRFWGWTAFMPDGSMLVRKDWRSALDAVRGWYVAQEAE